MVAEGGRSRGLDVRLQYREHSGDYQHVAREVRAPRLVEGDLHAGDGHPFAIALPADATPDFVSRHGRLAWEVVARSDEVGLDTIERVPLGVRSPGASEQAPRGERGDAGG